MFKISVGNNKSVLVANFNIISTPFSENFNERNIIMTALRESSNLNILKKILMH